jgi:hypothetical protein
MNRLKSLLNNFYRFKVSNDGADPVNKAVTTLVDWLENYFNNPKGIEKVSIPQLCTLDKSQGKNYPKSS